VYLWFVGGVLVVHLFSVLCCCDVRYDFRIKAMFGSSSLPPVICRRDRLLFTLFVFVCAYCVVLCFVFLCLVYPMLPVSLYCLFWIDLTVLSNIYCDNLLIVSNKRVKYLSNKRVKYFSTTIISSI
jgi:hypothetical protein